MQEGAERRGCKSWEVMRCEGGIREEVLGGRKTKKSNYKNPIILSFVKLSSERIKRVDVLILQRK